MIYHNSTAKMLLSLRVKYKNKHRKTFLSSLFRAMTQKGMFDKLKQYISFSKRNLTEPSETKPNLS